MLSRFEASWDPAVRVRVVAAKAGSAAIVVQSAGITVHLAPGEAVAVTLADGSSDVATQGSHEGTAWPAVVGLTLLWPDRTGVQGRSVQDTELPTPVPATEPPDDHTIVFGVHTRYTEVESAREPEPAPGIGGLAALEASLGRSEQGGGPAFPEAQDADLDAVDMTVVHSRRARAEALHAAEMQMPGLTSLPQPTQAAPEQSATPAAPATPPAPVMPAESSPSNSLSLPDAARPPVLPGAPSAEETPAPASAVPVAQQHDGSPVSAQRPVLAQMSAPLVVSVGVSAPTPTQAPASKRGKLSSLLRGRSQAGGSNATRAASTTATTGTNAAAMIVPVPVQIPGSPVDEGDDQTITVAQLRAAQAESTRQAVAAPEPPQPAEASKPLRLQVPTAAGAMMSAPGVAPGSTPVAAPAPPAPTPPAFPESVQAAAPKPAVLAAPVEPAEPAQSADLVESAAPAQLPAERSEAITPTEPAEPSEAALPTPSEDEDATITRADLLAALAEARARSTSDHTVVGLSPEALDADRTITAGGRRGLAGQAQQAAGPVTPAAAPVAIPVAAPLPTPDATAAQPATPSTAPSAVPAATAESHVEDELTIARSAMFSSPGAPAFLAPAVKRRSTQPTQAPAVVGQGTGVDYTTQAPRVEAVASRAEVPAPAPPAGVPSFDPNATGPRLLIVDVDGERFAKLEGTLVIGRTPSVAQVRERDARGVTVTPTGTGVSHSHVSVRRQGGVVLVRDLWSTNGTRVRSAGVPPFRLRDGEEVPVSDGTRIELGDGVSLTVIDDGGQHGS